MTDQRTTLRALLNGEPFIAGDCNSAMSARILEHVGFSAAYIGGHATGMTHYAIPDFGVLTPSEMIEQSGRVARAIAIPLIADADTLGESVADVHRFVRGYEQAGVAGVHLEDEQNPKHTAFDGPLIPIAEMQARIATATQARQSPDFIIIARSDELYVERGGGTGSVDEAITRGNAYAEAGADVFLPTFASEEDLARIAAEVPIPVASYGRLVPGVQLSLRTGFSASSAARAQLQWATTLLATGDLPDEAFGFPLVNELTDYAEYDEVVAGWARRTARPLR